MLSKVSPFSHFSFKSSRLGWLCLLVPLVQTMGSKQGTCFWLASLLHPWPVVFVLSLTGPLQVYCQHLLIKVKKRKTYKIIGELFIYLPISFLCFKIWIWQLWICIFWQGHMICFGCAIIFGTKVSKTELNHNRTINKKQVKNCQIHLWKNAKNVCK